RPGPTHSSRTARVRARSSSRTAFRPSTWSPPSPPSSRRRRGALTGPPGSPAPDGAARGVLERDAPAGELVADPVGLGEVLRGARGVAGGDERADLVVVLTAHLIADREPERAREMAHRRHE